jgi:hypothetical protein
MHPSLQVHGALSRGAFAGVVLLSLAVLFAPATDVPSAPLGVDKLVHAALFAALAFTGRWAGIGTGALAGLLAGYAVVSELIQGFTPLARSASVADGLADVTGIVIGLTAWAVFSRRTSPAP